MDFDFELHDYELLEPLGEGGMAQTFLARRRGSWGDFSRLCVIKRPLVGSKDYDERELEGLFAAEVHLCAALQHPNIAMTFDAGEDSQGVPYLAMEYIDGIDLESLLRVYEGMQTQLPIDVAAFIAAEAAKALHHAHGVTRNGRALKIVHRDVSPDNFMIDRNGHVTLLDFGASHYAERGRFTKTHEARGKSLYMSPEHLGAIEMMDGRSDLFSLGIVLYRMLTGTHPFKDRSKATLEGMLQSIRDASYKEPRLLARNLPRSLSMLVQQLLAPLKDGRPATGAAVAQACAEHFRPVTTQDELATIVATALFKREQAANGLEEGALASDDGADAIVSAPVATIRPSSSVATAKQKKKRAPARRSARDLRSAWWKRPSVLAAAAAIGALGILGTTGAQLLAREPREPTSLQQAPRSGTAPSGTNARPTPSTHVETPAVALPTAGPTPEGGAAVSSSSLRQPEVTTESGPTPSSATQTNDPVLGQQPEFGTLEVHIGGGCIWVDEVPRGEQRATIKRLQPGTHRLGFSSDCKSRIDERHPVNVRAGSNRVTYPYLPAELPIP